jgi:hypothetical protein
MDSSLVFNIVPALSCCQLAIVSWLQHSHRKQQAATRLSCQLVWPVKHAPQHAARQGTRQAPVHRASSPPQVPVPTKQSRQPSLAQAFTQHAPAQQQARQGQQSSQVSFSASASCASSLCAAAVCWQLVLLAPPVSPPLVTRTGFSAAPPLCMMILQGAVSSAAADPAGAGCADMEAGWTLHWSGLECCCTCGPGGTSSVATILK